MGGNTPTPWEDVLQKSLVRHYSPEQSLERIAALESSFQGQVTSYQSIHYPYTPIENKQRSNVSIDVHELIILLCLFHFVVFNFFSCCFVLCLTSWFCSLSILEINRLKC